MNLTSDRMLARLTMPTTKDGYVVSLFYVPKAQLPAYEAQWREWLSQHPKAVWPEWVDAWAEHRKREYLAT
jgi:hypothetical protein